MMRVALSDCPSQQRGRLRERGNEREYLQMMRKLFDSEEEDMKLG